MRTRLTIAALVMAVAAAWLWRATSSSFADATAATAAKGPGVPVMAGEVSRADVPVFLTGLGTVRAFNSVLLTSRVDGQIVKINFTEGQPVHAGEVLVEIDAKPYEAALAHAQAARLKDEANLANARLDLERYRHLAQANAGPKQQADQQAAMVAQLEASISADQAAIDAATTQLNYCSIRSPFDGRAGTRQIDIGNIVRATGTAGIVTINQFQPISMDFNLPAETLPGIRARMASGIPVVALDRDEREVARGQLAVIDNQVSATTGTVHYKATFPNADEVLWPGQFYGVRVELDRRRDAITVPTKAVVRGPEGTYVFVIDKSRKAEKRKVEIGLTNLSVAVVERGLEPGEQVVTDGQFRIQAGTTVSIVAAAMPPEK